MLLLALALTRVHLKATLHDLHTIDPIQIVTFRAILADQVVPTLLRLDSRQVELGLFQTSDRIIVKVTEGGVHDGQNVG